jgi:hypothetical protein
VGRTFVSKPRSRRRLATLLAIAFAAAALAVPYAGANEIPITSVAGFPNPRTINELPPNAIDGDSTTFTWTTNPNNIASPSHLAIGFASTPVSRLRLWKERYGGGGQNIKNLTIQYTTDDPSVPLSSRSWINVTGLTNGFNGTELMVATAVNSNGTVTGDIHDSPTGDGWASLSFNLVTATGLRISFLNPNPSVPYCDGSFGDQACTHYHVGEFEAHGPAYLPGSQLWSLVVIGMLVASAGALLLGRQMPGTSAPPA